MEGTDARFLLRGSSHTRRRCSSDFWIFFYYGLTGPSLGFPVWLRAPAGGRELVAIPRRRQKAQESAHEVIRRDQVEVLDSLGPNGALVGRDYLVLDRQAVGVLVVQGQDPDVALLQGARPREGLELIAARAGAPHEPRLAEGAVRVQDFPGRRVLDALWGREREGRHHGTTCMATGARSCDNLVVYMWQHACRRRWSHAVTLWGTCLSRETKEQRRMIFVKPFVR